MRIRPTAIPDVKQIETTTYADRRGAFRETWRAADLATAGIHATFVQENFSRSDRGVLRGLHYQIVQPQGKLVSVHRGEVFDVAVDLRRNSPSFGHWVGLALSDRGASSIWVPPGFAHGFYVTSESAELTYLCTDYYSARDERTIRWDDPTLAIEWPLSGGSVPVLSEKDRAGGAFAHAECYECAC